MEQNLIDIYDLIEHAIDNAFEGNMNLKFYEYLKDNKTKKHEVVCINLLTSIVTYEIKSQCADGESNRIVLEKKTTITA